MKRFLLASAALLISAVPAFAEHAPTENVNEWAGLFAQITLAYECGDISMDESANAMKGATYDVFGQKPGDTDQIPDDYNQAMTNASNQIISLWQQNPQLVCNQLTPYQIGYVKNFAATGAQLSN